MRSLLRGCGGFDLRLSTRRGWFLTGIFLVLPLFLRSRKRRLRNRADCQQHEYDNSKHDTLSHSLSMGQICKGHLSPRWGSASVLAYPGLAPWAVFLRRFAARVRLFRYASMVQPFGTRSHGNSNPSRLSGSCAYFFQ